MFGATTLLVRFARKSASMPLVTVLTWTNGFKIIKVRHLYV
jgi:hypothetical protein